MNALKPTTIAGLLLTASIATVSLRVIAETPIPPTSLEFQNTVTGAPLDFSNAQPEGRDTPGVKSFFQTGIDPYIDDKSCLKKGEIIFLTACSGCHGLIGEGKIGPGLNDDYWTYPKNTEDKGLFETIFEGATAQMGPHYDLTLDEILQVMAWVRHLYKDDVSHAYWLNAEQKKNYKPYHEGEKFPDNPSGKCADKK